MKKLEKESINKKTVFLGLGHIMAYILLSMLPFSIQFSNRQLNIIFEIITYALIVIVACLFFKNRLKRDLKAFKNNFKNYVIFIIKNYFMLLIVYYLACFVSRIILKGSAVPVNQTEILSLPLIVIFFSAVVYAPIAEELIYRGSIRRLIKSDWLFIVISGCIFGFLHTVAESSFLYTFALGLPYIVVGMCFANAYVKSENLLVPISLHFLYNLIAVIVLLFT